MRACAPKQLVYVRARPERGLDVTVRLDAMLCERGQVGLVAYVDTARLHPVREPSDVVRFASRERPDQLAAARHPFAFGAYPRRARGRRAAEDRAVVRR